MDSGSIVAPGAFERGAENLVRRCLCVAPGEHVLVATWSADELFASVAAAVVRAKGSVQRFALEALTPLGETECRTRVAGAFSSVTASVFLGGAGFDARLAVYALREAERVGSRHVHMATVDPRIVGSSARADPDAIAVINKRVAEGLRLPARVRVTSAAGTALDVALSTHYPLVMGDGRPARGAADNIPSGFVYTHPAQIDGTFVADRAVVGSKVHVMTPSLRRAPVIARLAAGRVVAVECAHEATLREVEAALAAHPDATRVGMVVFPTNYLARSEIGVATQDGLLPGMNIGLGFSAATATRAPFDAPVQIRLLGRKVTVESHGRRLVDAGRFAADLVEGIDPFR